MSDLEKRLREAADALAAKDAQIGRLVRQRDLAEIKCADTEHMCYGALAAKDARIAELEKALKLAEDVLSRRPFSTQLWPNGMHPQIGIEVIRAALGGQHDQ